MNNDQFTTVPLTPEQQAWLKSNALVPVIGLTLGLGVVVVLGFCIVRLFLDNPVVKTGIGITGLLILGTYGMVGMHIWNNYADLRSGVAQIRIVRLVKKHATSQAPRTFYGEFETVGTIIVQHDDYQLLTEGASYRITYSPNTKRGWQVEPLV